jgi:hypothetical protein
VRPWERAQANPTTPTEAAGQDAVTAGTQTPRAQTVAGTIQAAYQTTPGALGTTVGQNLAFAGVNNVTTDTPEATALSWLVTFWFQGLKHSKHVNQDHAKWFILPLIAFVVGAFAYWAITPDHDFFRALGKALVNCGNTAVNAIANYHSTKPLGWFSSAAEMEG